MAVPVTNEAASEHNQTTASAISSGCPMRPIGSLASMALMIWSAQLGLGSQNLIDQRCLDRPRADGVDPNAGLGVLQGRGFRQAEDAVFAGRIGRHAVRAHQPEVRSGVDDCAPALVQHVREFVFHAQPHPGQVNGNECGPNSLHYTQPSA